MWAGVLFLCVCFFVVVLLWLGAFWLGFWFGGCFLLGSIILAFGDILFFVCFVWGGGGGVFVCVQGQHPQT